MRDRSDRRIVFALLVFPLLFSQLSVAAPQSLATVFTDKPALQSIFNILTYPARVESKVNAVVRAESDGVVAKILKPLGSRVQRGETIAIVQHTDPVYQYAPLNVIAPVSGVVNDVQVTPGSLLNKGDPVVTVTDPGQLRVVIEVAATDLGAVRTGLKGEMAFSGGAKPMSVEVLGVSPSIDPMLGTATCQLKVAEADRKHIVPGMMGNVQFKVNQRQGFMLSDSAIVYRGEETFIRLLDAGHAKRIPVKIGEKRQGQVEVVSGIKPGDIVIRRASRFVADGEAVQVDSASE